MISIATASLGLVRIRCGSGWNSSSNGIDENRSVWRLMTRRDVVPRPTGSSRVRKRRPVLSWKRNRGDDAA